MVVAGSGIQSLTKAISNKSLTFNRFSSFKSGSECAI